MCALCGILGGPEHWTDAAPRAGIFTRTADPLLRRRERMARVACARRVLGYRRARIAGAPELQLRSLPDVMLYEIVPGPELLRPDSRLVIGASGRAGYAGREDTVRDGDLTPLFETIVSHVPRPRVDAGPFRMLATLLDRDPDLHRRLPGERGELARAEDATLLYGMSGIGLVLATGALFTAGLCWVVWGRDSLKPHPVAQLM